MAVLAHQIIQKSIILSHISTFTLIGLQNYETAPCTLCFLGVFVALSLHLHNSFSALGIKTTGAVQVISPLCCTFKENLKILHSALRPLPS